MKQLPRQWKRIVWAVDSFTIWIKKWLSNRYQIPSTAVALAVANSKLEKIKISRDNKSLTLYFKTGKLCLHSKQGYFSYIEKPKEIKGAFIHAFCNLGLLTSFLDNSSNQTINIYQGVFHTNKGSITFDYQGIDLQVEDLGITFIRPAPCLFRF